MIVSAMIGFASLISKLKEILELSEWAIIAVIIFAVILFVFMIYVGICIIKMKNYMKKITELEYKRFAEEKTCLRKKNEDMKEARE